ncbi:MAG: alpha/beta fold hydrolase [Bacteroidales bacterium]|nr:alpha/beta fold hydrolase [Bacteroidales bacterium]
MKAQFILPWLVMALVVSLTLPGCASAAKSASTDSFSKEELWLNKDGQKIYGVLYRPEGIKKAPLLVVSHGIGSNHLSGAPYAEALVKLGYAVYCYDFCGGGRASKSDGKTSEMSIFSEEKDLEAVVDGLKNVEGIKKGKVTLLGISQGGMVSALFAGDHPKMVEKLVLVYPALCIKDDWVTKYPKITDMPEVVNSFGMQLGRAYVEGLYDLDVYGRIARYEGQVQILHGDQDRLVPISYSEKAHEAYRNSAFKVMPGAGHGFRGKVQEEAIEIIKNFLKK